MAKDKFANIAQSPTLPASGLGTNSPNDGADLEQVTLALNVATPGIDRVTTNDWSVGEVFIEAGTAFPLRVRRVWAAGTTATGIRGLY
jgi:hypothetical protein